MEEVFLSPHHMVAKKLSDISKQTDRLHEFLSVYVTKAVMEGNSIIESTSEDNVNVFLNAFFKLDKVLEVLRSIDVTLQDAFLLPKTCVEKNQNGLAHVQIECLQKNYHMTQETLIKQEAKIATCAENVENILLRLNNLEKDKEVMQHDIISSVDESKTQFSKELNLTNQTLTTKFDAFSLGLNKVTRNLQSKLDSVCKQVDGFASINGEVIHNYFESSESEMKVIQEKLRDTDSKYEQLCLLLATKVVHLEKVRNSLNAAHACVEKRSELEKCCKKNQELIDVLVSHIDSVESASLDMQANKHTKPPVAFTAQLSSTRFMCKGNMIRNLDYVLCNKGGNFNGQRGTFTTCTSGLFCFALSIRRVNNTPCTISIVRQTGRGKVDILETQIQNETTYSVQTAVHLEKSDVVFVQVRKAEPWVILHHTTTFSGWSIG